MMGVQFQQIGSVIGIMGVCAIIYYDSVLVIDTELWVPYVKKYGQGMMAPIFFSK